jgi:oligopeptidase B
MASLKTSQLLPAPRAEKRPTTQTVHGVTLTDEFAWLRADNWQEVMRKPEVLPQDIRAYVEAENAYCETALADTKPLQDELFEEMKARIKEDDSSVPTPDGAYAYNSRFVTGAQYPIYIRTPRNGGAETILLDGNKEAEGKEFWMLGGLSHSPDHKLIAYGVDDKGSELFTLKFRDIATGRDLDDVLEDTAGGGVWAADSKTVFYTKRDENHRPKFIYRHRLGTPQSADVLVYEEQDPGFMAGVSRTQSGDMILIETHDHQTSEVHIIDAHTPDGPIHLVAAREPNHEYSVEHWGDDIIITTNADGAEDFKIMTAPYRTPERKNWRDFVSHKPGRLILSVVPLKNHLIRLEREDGLPRIVVRDMRNGSEHSIAFPEEAYSLGMSAGYEFDTTQIRFTYSSLTTPNETYDYDVVTKERTLRKRQEVPSGHNTADYVTRRVFATASDGEKIPITLLYGRGTKLDGSAPLLLYGYGSYGIAMPASFSIARLSLVDRGFVYAIAHIRGGKDKGYAWYKNGKMSKKMNTFTDFITAGEFLVREKYTSRGRIVAQGGSAGGMLVGASVNLAPDLFLGIIADVPFVDVMNTMLDDTLPLTPPEWLEWGNPKASREEFDWIMAYSPYDNVGLKAYPHIYAFAGLTDPRVTYWEPAKWIARLRDRSTSDNLILLKTNMGAGHGGASGRFAQLKEVATDFAFAIKVAGLLGVKPKRARIA